MNTVRNVATNRPPIIVAAIPPNIASGRRGNMPRMVVPEAMATGTSLDLVAATTAS